MVQLLNPDKASHYLDTVSDERQRSAVLAIHLAWLNHSSPVCRGERIDPRTPLDLLILYRAAAATFQDWPPLVPSRPEPLSGGHVINHQQANERLRAVTDEESQRLASSFARQVIALSSSAANEQNLDYYVELFLRCISDKRVIANIASGTINKHSAQLSDPDLW
jgi:hypothetical protein